jgi:hypothetical protein
MANITSDRDTKIKAGDSLFHLPVAAGVKIFKGGIVGLNAAGFVVPVSGTGIKAPARAEEDLDNTAGTDGLSLIKVWRGVVGLDIGAGITQATVGTMVYLSDDHTVTATGTGNHPAGILLELTDGQAWVDLKSAAAGSTAFAALADHEDRLAALEA